MELPLKSTDRNISLYIVVAVLFLAFALRLAFLIISSRNVLPTGDEGLLMLQAKAIWQGREWPLLFWAQPYTFPIESYMNAPFSAILPSNAFGARLAFWFWGLASCLLALSIVRMMGAMHEVWPAYLLVLFPSAYLLMLQAGYAPPSYPSYMALFFLAIYFAKKSEIVKDLEGATQKLIWVALSGFFAGLASSVSMLAMPILLGLGVFYSMRGRFSASLQQVLIFVAGAFVGLIPHIMARTFIPGAYSAVSGYRAFPEAIISIWKIGIQHTLSRTFGLHSPVFPDLSDRTLTSVKEFAEVFYIVWLMIFIAVLVLGSYRLIQNTRRSGWFKLDFVHIFSVVTILAIILFGLSTRARSDSYRYLLPVVLCFPFQVAYLYRHMNRPLRVLFGGFVVLLVMINITHSKKLMRFWKGPDFGRAYAEVRTLEPLITILDREGIRYAYGSWFSAHRLTYVTDERIISGQYYNERFYDWPTPYRAQIDAQQEVAFVLDWSRAMSPHRFESEMTRVYPAAKYRKSRADYYTVYHDFQHLPQPEFVRLSPVGSSVVTSHNQADAEALIDQTMSSLWHSGEKQKTGMFIEIQLPRQQSISSIKLHYFNHAHLQAKSLKLLASRQGEWHTVQDNIEKDISFLDVKQAHPVVGDYIQKIEFPAITTDKLRIEIEEPDKKREWWVWEIEVFAPQSL